MEITLNSAYYFACFIVLGIELRASHSPGKSFTTELYPQWFIILYAENLANYFIHSNIYLPVELLLNM